MEKRKLLLNSKFLFFIIILFLCILIKPISSYAAKNIGLCTISGYNIPFMYTGSAIKPTITIKDGNKILKNNTDYTVSYRNNINVGTAEIRITGKGNYSGTVTKYFNISKRNISLVATTTYIPFHTYTGSAIKPTVTVRYGNIILKNNTDYTVLYSKNTTIGKAEIRIIGKGNYSGTITREFYISSRSISSDYFLTTLTYNWKGMNINSFKSKSSDGTFSIKNNKMTATYLATNSNHFIYIPKEATNFSSIKLDTLLDLNTNKTLINGTDYTVTYSYSTNKCIITISGRGNYTGTKIINCIAK